MREFIINKNDASLRVDVFLRKAVPRLPGSLAQKLIRKKDIKLNGKRCDGSDRLSEGDILRVYAPDKYFEEISDTTAYKTVVPKLNIVYEDKNILLVDKRPGMVVHKDETECVNTLILHIQAYLYSKGEWNPEEENAFVPALCNRIDRNTGGIVIAAKNAESLRIMNEKIRLRELRKLYFCLVHGVPDPPKGRIEGYIRRDIDGKKVYFYEKPVKDGRNALTDYRVFETRGGISLVECELHTGRTHQIRVSMAYIGCPLVGDTKYGRTDGYRRQALYSYKLEFCFKSDSGILDYLNGKSFQIEDIDFLRDFRKI
ncbi:MAG: RluA family pseudouridine synthase [Clostridiales bacterium]|nr:RluA family pseudouridine synthase [Clostridiales bacterium]